MPPLTLFTKPWFRLFFRAAAAVMLLVMSLGIYLNARNGVPMYVDFNTLIASPISYTEGGDLYRPYVYMPIMGHIVFTQPVGRADHSKLTNNLNAPAVNFLLLPFSQLGMRPAYYSLCAVQLGLSLLVLWRILLRVMSPTAMPLATATLLLCAYFPISANMLLGQIGLFLFILLGGFWLFLQDGKERLAGVLLGLALVMKIFVGLVFVWLLLRRRWQILLWGALVWASVMLAGLLVFGVQNHLDWLTVLKNVTWGTQSWNGALHATLGRYLGGSITASPLDWPWLRWAIRSLALIGAAAALIWLSRQADKLGAGRCLNLGLALTLPLMLFLTPLGWIYYFPVLFISCTVFWRESAALEKPGRLRGGLLATMALSGTPQLITAYDNQRPELWRTLHYGATFDQDAQGQTILRYEGEHHWFVLPDVYPLALLLLSLLLLRLSWRLVQNR